MGRFNNNRRGDDDAGQAKADRAARDAERKREADEKRDAEGAEVDEKQRNRVQDQMGNQAVLSMISDMAGAGGGVEVERSELAHKPKPHEKDGVEHGGDDDGDPGPITIHDLAQNWNPGMRRVDDKAAFLDAMPDDELPPEDEAFLASVEDCDDPIALVEGDGQRADEALTPSAEVVRIALTAWARSAATWGAPDLSWQLARWLVAPPVSALQDLNGRVVLSRSRAASIALALLLEAPVLRASREAAPSLAFALELSARAHRVKAVEILSEEKRGQTLPVALDIFRGHQGEVPPGRVEPRTPPPAALATFTRILDDLVRYDDESTLVAEVAAENPPPEPDDPLGIDAVLDSFTGGRPDPMEILYEAAIQNAERVAAAAARSRVLYAGLGVAVAEVAALGPSGIPTENLEAAMAAFDRDVASCLQLLLEIARSAQRRGVPPSGLHTGLRRAARTLGRLRQRGTRALVDVIGGLLPETPEMEPPAVEIPPAVHAALAIGRPINALPWLEDQPPSLDRDTAIVLLKAAAGALPPDLVVPVKALRERWRHESPGSTMGTALDVLLGALVLFEGRMAEAFAIADELTEVGRTRRNGLWIAEGALLAMEAHLAGADLDAVAKRRHRAGNLLHRMGARGALSLLARWTPPVIDEEFDD